MTIIAHCYYRLVDNLTSRQLRANAEIKLSDNRRIGIDDGDVEVTNESVMNDMISESMAQSSNHTVRHTRTPVTYRDSIPNEYQDWMTQRENEKSNYKPRWIKGADFDIEKPTSFSVSNYSKYENMSIVDIFEQFIDIEFVEHLVAETRRYALFLNCPDPKITADDIRCFFAILFISGYNNLPSKRHYWDSKDDMKNLAVSQSMRRDRFLQICRFIHCADNTKIDETDRAWKIRPLMEMLKKKCTENFIPEEHLAYDESMVKYFGRHGCKQFIRGKPIRFGYKIWSLNTKDGYLVNFELYQGKGPKANTDYDKLFGKCASPLLVLLDEMPDAKKKLRYKLYMDNLFSGPALFSFLKFRGYSAIGTIRENRIPKECPLLDKRAFVKRDRGYFETAMERCDGHLFVRWMDNSVVTMISSSCGTEEVSQVKRFSQKEKRSVMIPRPNVIAKYNSFMGGTDQMDQNINCYRIGIKGKKWYWPLFTWMLDVAVQNSWVLYNKSHTGKVSQLEFRRELANVYLTKYKVEPKGVGRPPVSAASASNNRISDDIRFDRTDHLVQRTESNRKRRCAKTACKSIVRTMCRKCDVALCIDCFSAFHSR